MSGASFSQQLAGRWAALGPRERTLATIAAAFVGVALLWWLALAPALATLRAAETQHRSLDAQLERMRSLQAQAQALQAQPRLGYDEAFRALEVSVRDRLGAAGRLTVAGERATVTLTGAAPDALAQWLAQARANARLLPGEARLTRNAKGGWDGSVVLNLPAR